MVNEEDKEKENNDLGEFDRLTDQLADEFEKLVGDKVIELSDYAVSRECIYEEHP